ncbi:MAG: cytochrome c [Verrucomicrobiota bacterium]
MYEDEDQIQEREKADPNEGDRPWPLSMWILILSMTSFAFAYLLIFSGDGSVGDGDLRAKKASAPSASKAETSAPAELDSLKAIIAQGENVYRSICLACHQTNGAGIPGAFPPLDGSSWVNGPAETPTRIVLHGLTGPIDVKGQTYNGVMPGFAAQLSDDDIAAVVTYIRSTWSNQTGPIDSEFVNALRENSGQRGPWTANELRDAE